MASNRDQATGGGGGLAARLKTATRELHAQAERSGVMGELLHRRLPRGRYVALLANLHAIYEALEAHLDAGGASAPWADLWDPGLRRAGALAADLDELSPGWRPAPLLVEATRGYVARLATVATQDPVRLVAHAYVRYLGDLHGGQMLAGLVREQYGLAPGAASRFYDFGDNAQVATRRDRLRAALDALALPDAGRAAVVDEACRAFEAHRALFVQLHECTVDAAG